MLGSTLDVTFLPSQPCAVCYPHWPLKILCWLEWYPSCKPTTLGYTRRASLLVCCCKMLKHCTQVVMSGIGRRWLQVDSNNCNVPWEAARSNETFILTLLKWVDRKSRTEHIPQVQRRHLENNLVVWRKKIQTKGSNSVQKFSESKSVLFRSYQSKCPDSWPKDAFYLGPLTKSTENCWYAPHAIGCDTLHNTISRVCTATGFRAFINQSLPLGHVSNWSLSSWCELTTHHAKDRSS